MRRILYIEDMEAEAVLVEKLYQMCNKCFEGEVEFMVAASWESGMEMVERMEIDVLVVDLALPPFSPDETLDMLSKRSDLPPVVVLTGNDYDLSLRRKSMLAGADDFMLKSDMRRHPEALCERVYTAYLRRNRERLLHATS